MRLSVGLEDVDDLIWDLDKRCAEQRASGMILTTPSQRRDLLERDPNHRDGRRIEQSATARATPSSPTCARSPATT